MPKVAIRRFFRFALILAVCALPFVAFLQRQNIYDYWRLRNYTPAPSISSITADIKLTSYGEKLFYVMHPEIDGKEAFNSFCRKNEQTIVLGCHVSGKGIYLLQVDDTRLKGVEQVTAAHEMLHEAFERLSPKERNRISDLVTDTYKKLNEDRLNKTIDLYRQQDASEVPNELHSILGTEYRNLPPELETYYSRYFENRQAVVTFSAQYESVFEERRNAVTQYDGQLSALKNQIDSLEAQLAQQQSDITTQRAQLDALLKNNQREAYNAQVPSFNAKVQAYNAAINTLKGLVTQYNRIVADRNAIASEEAQLVQAIDSRTEPQATK